MPKKEQQCKPLRAKRIKLGAIIEIPVRRGFAYAQYFYKTVSRETYIRIFKGIFQERPKDFIALTNQNEQFITVFPIAHELGDELCRVVGWVPIPERLQKLPLIKQLWGPHYFPDTPYHWRLRDNETGKSWKVGGETYERQKVGAILPKEYHHLPSNTIMTYESLVDLIERGWTNKSDVFGPSYGEIVQQRIQERLASEKQVTPSPLPRPASILKRILSPRPNPIAGPLQKLLTRMDRIMEKHEELGDTDVREQLHAAVYNAFILAKADYMLPKEFGMFTKTGNRHVRSALATFLTKATNLATKTNWEPGMPRLVAFQDIDMTSENGSTYDVYFGDHPQAITPICEGDTDPGFPRGGQ